MSSENAELKVTFFPPLYLQRRIWVLNILRREHVTEIIDIGCGSGDLLAALCQPAQSLPPPNPASGMLSGPASDALLGPADDLDIHPVRVDGLDISHHKLESAIQYASLGTVHTRWEPLKLSIWHGGLEVFNPAFVAAECIVATEVIEHLPDDVLAYFVPMMLGAYHPRLLLVTTPSYTFNARFSPPGMMSGNGYPDPTKRTNRTFRHHDHKFEWTVEQFQKWCDDAAREWGYQVDTATIGYAQEKDEWNREEELKGASQVALFTRLDGDEGLAAMREEKSEAVRERKDDQTEHRLLGELNYDAHVSAGKRSSAEEIVEAVEGKFGECDEIELRLDEVWLMEDIGGMCGGYVEVLIEVIEESAKFSLERGEGQRRGDWMVVLVGGVKKKKTPGWSPPQTADDGVHTESRQESDEEDIRCSWGGGECSVDSEWDGDSAATWGSNGMAEWASASDTDST